MNTTRLLSFVLPLSALLASCASYPTLEQTARARARTKLPANPPVSDAGIEYQITDLDVLNYADAIKTKLARKFDSASVTRYGSSTAAVTLSSLAGAANTAGWGAASASGLGMGAAYILSLGHIIDAKGNAAAYEQAFTAIQAAEANFYFHQTGMSFTQADGKWRVVLPDNQNQQNHIPYSDRLTPDGQTLYYRVSKTLKVLDDVLASKIPNLDDLKEAQGENAGTSPLKTTTSSKASANTGSGKGGSGKSGSSKNGSNSGSGKTSSQGSSTNKTGNGQPPADTAAALQAAKEAATQKLVNMTDAQASAALGETTDPKGARERLQNKISDATTVEQLTTLVSGSASH